MNITRAVLDTSLTDGRWLALPPKALSLADRTWLNMVRHGIPGGLTGNEHPVDTLLRVERCQTCGGEGFLAAPIRDVLQSWYTQACPGKCGGSGFLRAGLLTVKAVLPVTTQNDAMPEGREFPLPGAVPDSVVLDLAPAECERCGDTRQVRRFDDGRGTLWPCPDCTGPVSVEFAEGSPIGTVTA